MSANIKQYLPAFYASQAFADRIKVCWYPINMFSILRRNRRILVSSFSDYKTWAKQIGLSCPDKLKDAKCYYRPADNIYLIVYNEKKPKQRINFSLAHELAHIVLGHLNDERTEIDRGGLDDFTYFAMEGAANTFAGNFLAPPILIHEFIAGGHFDIGSIARRFDLSKEAVRGYRKQDYQYWLTIPHSEHERQILERYAQLLNTFFCDVCGVVFAIKCAKYCPICGSPSTPLKARNEKIMGRNYPSMATNEAGQVVECPNCENVEHLKEASFCMICGKPIINQCTFAICEDAPYGTMQCNHTEPLPGNARYCPYCGSETTFLREGLLLKWQQEPQELSSLAFSELTDDDDELPF